MVDSLLGGSALNYVGHRACVRKASLAARRENMHAELGELARRKDLEGGKSWQGDKKGNISVALSPSKTLFP